MQNGHLSDTEYGGKCYEAVPESSSGLAFHGGLAEILQPLFG